jgi:DNA (cytosine-5)-methyltransferase 1
MFENVKGLTVGAHKAFLHEVVQAFSDAGYQVRLPWRVLDAAYYGVPQHRERLILLGARKGLRLPDYPHLRTNPADTPKKFPGLSEGPTCKDALQDLPDADSFLELIDADAVRTSAFGNPSGYARELRCLTGASWHYGYVRRWDPELLTSSARTSHTGISSRRFTETEPGEVEAISRFLKLPGEGLSNTLRAGTDGARGAFTSPRPIHFAYPRCITVREMARLHGFPDWFRFHATKWHGARQIGNSVPPPLARAIAGSIFTALEFEPERPERIVDLGDPALLSMDMSEAARHFGVQPPNGRRDRKSGAKKRKQHEIEEERLRIRATGD